jgi:hypothetical protein
MSVQQKLLEIQNKLKVSKEQYNSFGNYKYRSCEDILEGVKPLLAEIKATLTLSDDINLIGDRFYIKATATLTDIEDNTSTSAIAFAREDLAKKGMDLAQVTGSVSSYARKYALNGLFCIDDTKDSDHLNKGETTSAFITGEQAKIISALCTKEWGNNAKANFQKLTGYKSTLEIPSNQYDKIKKAITAEVVEL